MAPRVSEIQDKGQLLTEILPRPMHNSGLWVSSSKVGYTVKAEVFFLGYTHKKKPEVLIYTLQSSGLYRSKPLDMDPNTLQKKMGEATV